MLEWSSPLAAIAALKAIEERDCLAWAWSKDIDCANFQTSSVVDCGQNPAYQVPDSSVFRPHSLSWKALSIDLRPLTECVCQTALIKQWGLSSPRVCRLGTEKFCWATLSKSRTVYRLDVLLFAYIWMLNQPLSILIAADHRYSMRREEGLLDFITDKQQNEHKKLLFVTRVFLWSDFPHQTSRVFEVTKLCPICE